MSRAVTGFGCGAAAVIAFALALTGCTSDEPPHISAEPLLLDDLTVVVSEEDRRGMDALLTDASVVAIDGCIGLVVDESQAIDGEFVAVFPPGTRVEDGMIRVADDGDREGGSMRLGDVVDVGGGAAEPENVPGDLLPDSCSGGQVWYVGAIE